jgi:hypothetical protein
VQNDAQNFEYQDGDQDREIDSDPANPGLGQHTAQGRQYRFGEKGQDLFDLGQRTPGTLRGNPTQQGRGEENPDVDADDEVDNGHLERNPQAVLDVGGDVETLRAQQEEVGR